MSFAKAQELLRLAMMATGRRGVSLAEIEAEFDCSDRTAQRMTDALQSAFPQTERVVGDDRRARWVVPSRAIAPLITPSADELVALGEAVKQLETAGLGQEALRARSLERKVRALIPPEQGTRLDVDAEAVLEALGRAARPGPRPAADERVVGAIYEALKGPNLLRILYRKREEDEPRERVVAPHGLLLGVRRYLVARDTAKGPSAGLQHYRVEEIYEAELLDGTFEIDPGFNLRCLRRRALALSRALRNMVRSCGASHQMRRRTRGVSSSIPRKSRRRRTTGLLSFVSRRRAISR